MHEEWTDVLPKNMPTRARQLACLEGTPPFVECGIPASCVQLSQDIERHVSFLCLRPPDITSFETAHF